MQRNFDRLLKHYQESRGYSTVVVTCTACLVFLCSVGVQINRFVQQLQGATLEELERTTFGAVQDLSPKFDDECKASNMMWVAGASAASIYCGHGGVKSGRCLSGCLRLLRAVSALLCRCCCCCCCRLSEDNTVVTSNGSTKVRCRHTGAFHPGLVCQPRFSPPSSPVCSPPPPCAIPLSSCRCLSVP